MPPSEKDRVRLHHMMDACRKALFFASDKTREDLENDELLALALVRLLEVIGEASKGTSEELRARCPMIKWRALAGTRDRLIHGYFDVDLDIVWKIVSVDLPQLADALADVLKQ
ncbi:MAG: DUF86 domain-containing protein [Actinobacteria bacterium]|nr:DUF86 domain-containing protein [Actinomycetota bacterium]MCG2818812.1 DUF86 domain-containing protein [Actinomycetes bacterium]MBU4219230.1 DUF86 domain-containing protein [Actinomycetota bacterium]MBU4359487.1 DUF86 domain-containing protein [Actinomycetota bacterium]MBU4392877.1 DUF86 domain-containing protein [Actinomycetota bacterium]